MLLLSIQRLTNSSRKIWAFWDNYWISCWKKLIIWDLYIKLIIVYKYNYKYNTLQFVQMSSLPACKVVMEKHISRILLAIEGSWTGGKSTAVIIVAHVISLGRLSSQNWTTSASLSVSWLLWSDIFFRSPWLMFKAWPINLHLHSMGDNKRIRFAFFSTITKYIYEYIQQ